MVKSVRVRPGRDYYFKESRGYACLVGRDAVHRVTHDDMLEGGQIERSGEFIGELQAQCWSMKDLDIRRSRILDKQESSFTITVPCCMMMRE